MAVPVAPREESGEGRAERGGEERRGEERRGERGERSEERRKGKEESCIRTTISPY